ncbi:MAG: hypothetical protein RLZZ410_12, partial [Pseudomonadota bacterium]
MFTRKNDDDHNSQAEDLVSEEV